MTVDLTATGVGCVALPLRQGAVRAGLTVRGFDIGEPAVTSLNRGRAGIDHFTDVLAAGATRFVDTRGDVKDCDGVSRL